MLRDGKTGDWIGTFTGHKGAVNCTRPDAGMTHVVTSSADYTAKVWDAATGDEVVTFEHKKIVRAAHFSRSSEQIYTGGDEKKLRIFDLSKPEEKATMFDTDQKITHIVSPPDSNLIITASPEKCIRIWDKRSGTCERQLSTSADLSSLTLSLDDSVLAAAANREVSFFNANTLELIRSFRLGRDVSTISVHPQTKRFITACDTVVRAYDYESGLEIGQSKGHHGQIRCVAFDSNGENYASGSDDSSIRIWFWPES